MGEGREGRRGFSSWTLHMASIIVFGTPWCFAFVKWVGVTEYVVTVDAHGAPVEAGMLRTARKMMDGVVF